MLGNTLPLYKYIISHIKRFCNRNFAQLDVSNGSLCITSKRKEARHIFSFCQFEPRPLKPTHDFWCGCPQPGALKIGDFLPDENYSNTAKNTQTLKSLISCAIRRFFILIFTGGKENKNGSEMQRKHNKSNAKIIVG